jgi:hypothetical protein
MPLGLLDDLIIEEIYFIILVLIDEVVINL